MYPDRYQRRYYAFITADGDFNAARSARLSASDAFQQTDATLSTWLHTTRNILAGRFGSRWSTMWAQAGFIKTSTMAEASPAPAPHREKSANGTGGNGHATATAAGWPLTSDKLRRAPAFPGRNGARFQAEMTP